MEIDQILHDFAHSKALPAEAMRAAAERRDEIVPVFLDILRRCIDGDPELREEPSPVFFTVLMLGQFREKAAFPLLMRLLRIDRDDLDALLGDAITETMPKVLAATFDGDLRLLYDVIEDDGAYDMTRWQLLEVLAMLVRQGDADRDEIARYLRQCYTTLQPQEEDVVWVGWQAAIALLGLKELRDLVEEAFKRPLVPPEFLSFSDFLEDLEAADDPDKAAALFERERLVPYDDAIEEVSHWHSFSEPSAGTGDFGGGGLSLPDLAYHGGTVVNPYRHVGRNDPCPCGSGKKFKKCCLPKVEAGGLPG